MTPLPRLYSRRGLLGLACALGVSGFIGLHSGRRPDYERLVRLWRRRLELEAHLFQRLRFDLSPLQLRRGLTLKLMLRDQLGDDWLFKMGDAAIDGAEAVYRIGCLLGWETPELHRSTLRINDRMVSGSVQRFIGGAEELAAHVFGPSADPRRFSDSALEYLLAAQIIGWITANHHVHTRQFITTARGDSVDRVYRIDNTVEWFLVGHDKLAAHYVAPLLSRKISPPKLGYNWMWRCFRESVIDLPLAKIHAFTRLVAELPDEVFRGIFQPGIENDFRYFSNASELILRGASSKISPAGDKKRFLEALVDRKRRLPEDTAALFDEEIAKRGGRPAFRDGPTPRAIGEELCERLETRNREIEQRAAKLPGAPAGQEPIHALTSFAAHSVLLRTFVRGSVSHDRKIQARRFQASVDELRDLRERTEDLNERAAIGIAIDAVRAEIANPKAPLEYLLYVINLNNLFPVFPVCPEGESPR